MLTISLVNGIAYGSLLFLLAAGFSMIFGVLKVVNLAHGSFFLLGAHAAISVYEMGGGVLLALVAGAAVGAVLGAIAEKAILYRLQGDYLAQVLVTVGILLILGDVAEVIWGGTPRMLSLPPSLVFRVPLGAFSYPGDRLALVVIGAVAALALWWATDRTRFGAMVRAAVDDEETAQAVGIAVPRLRVAVFALGGGLAGLSGALGAAFIGAKPGIDLEVFLLSLVIVVVGGVGSLPGAYLAALLVGSIDSVGKAYWPEASLFMLFVPMAIFLVVRPSGLFGRPLGVTVPVRRPPRRLVLPAALHALLRQARALAGAVPPGLLVLCGGTALVAVPFLATQYATSLLSLALIWAIFALGLNIVLGYGGMPSLGHAAFFGMGAYAVTFAGSHWRIDGWTAIAFAAFAASALAALLAAVALRTRQVHFLLTTVALSEIVWGIAFKWRSLTGGDDGQRNAQAILVPFGRTLPQATRIYAVAASIFVASVILLWFFHRSRFRLVLNGVRENDTRLAALGYDTFLYRYGAFVLSGGVSGIGGALFAYYATFVSPDLLDVRSSAKVLLMVIVGGAGTLMGPIIGAFAIVLIEEVLSGWTERANALEGLLYIAVALMARGGIAGALGRSRSSAAAQGSVS